jgi:hypothetical protein
MLLAAVRGESERITVGEILDGLDARAFGLATLIFSLPSCIPMPPGVPTVVGVALLIVSFQMVFGRRELWLPRFLTKRSFERAGLVTGLEQILKYIQWLERFARPRLIWMTGGFGTVLIGLIVALMAIILILPLPPGGNFPPAVACAVLGLALAERDGVIVLIGLATSVAAIVAAWIVTVGFIEYLPRLIVWLRGIMGL